MTMSKKRIKELAEEYLNTELSDDPFHKDEYYGTPKTVGESFINGFVNFIIKICAASYFPVMPLRNDFNSV